MNIERNHTRLFFGAIYFCSFIKNSMLVAGSSVELYFNIFLYFLVLCLTLYSLPKIKKLDDKLNGEHFFLLLLTALLLFYFDDGHTMFFTLIYLVALMKINNEIDFFLPICRIIVICLLLILFLQITGIYRFKEYAAYNIIKGRTVQLGFRNVNTFGAYCYNALLIFYLFKRWKWFLLSLIILIVSTYYTQSRTPLLAIALLLMLSVLKSKFINKKVSVFLISAFTLFIVFIGFVTIFLHQI